MKESKIKTVYVPVNGSSTLFVVEEGRISDSVEEQQLITFTPEEYNKHIQEVIEDALKTAAESKCTYIKIDLDGRRTHPTGLCKESIINTSKQTFEKWKI